MGRLFGQTPHKLYVLMLGVCFSLLCASSARAQSDNRQPSPKRYARTSLSPSQASAIELIAKPQRSFISGQDSSPSLSAETTCTSRTSMGSVEVNAQLLNDWGEGATWEITVTNHDQERPVSGLELQVIIPGASDLETWGMDFEVRLPMVRASLPDWQPSVEPGDTHSFGFNVFPSAQPCRIRILSMEVSSFEPTPTGTPIYHEEEESPESVGEPLPPIEEDEVLPTFDPIVYDQPSTEPLPVPGAPQSPTASGRFAPPLSTQGRLILNSYGEPVLLRGINWYGCETETFVFHGLWARNWKQILDQLADEGFNTLRVPYSQDDLTPGKTPKEGSVSQQHNPDLFNSQGQLLTVLEITDKIVERAGQRGMYIIFDRHALAHDQRTELWYTGSRTASSSSNRYGEAAWIEGLEQLARRYKNQPHVVGFDLHNEPRGRATWGSGDIDTDWRLAAQRGGNRLLATNPNLLVIVEGVEDKVNGSNAQGYWWGGNLIGARNYPVELTRADRVVYSPHDYGAGVYPQSWFYDPSFPNNLPEIWETYWAYLALENRAPILVGEFGGWSVDPSNYQEGTDPWREAVWQQALVDYQIQLGASATYWCANPESLDTGGYFQSDWQTVVTEKRELLTRWFAP